MGSIRPLITITILVVVGAYLYVKINEGPARPVSETDGAWQDAPPIDVPPVGASATVAPPEGQSAPAWPGSAVTSAPTPTADVAATADIAATLPAATSDTKPTNSNLADKLPPAVPPIPELPEAPATIAASAPAQSPVTLPTALPANIPTAKYPGESAPSAANGASESEPAPVASLSGSVPAATEPAVPAYNQSLAPASTTTPSITPQPDSIANTLPSESPLPAEGAVNPLRQTQPPTAVDRYAMGSELAAQSAVAPASSAPGVNSPATSQPQGSFATEWPAIQTALDRGELARAHQLLSPWHNAPTLTAAEAEKVDSLLGQLAGTVIYSTEHQLAPAHVVKPGETLETIAQECNVPWQLLAKINGIAAVDQVRPGQELKVVRGPFSAVVDVQRSELALTVDGRYAGKFPVTIPPGATVSASEWVVGDKSIAPTTSYGAARTADHAIELRSDTGAGPVPGGASLTIASGESPAGAAASPSTIRVSPQDAEELSDILSIGSRIVIRR